MGDPVEEELAIMDERSSESPAISLDVFQERVSRLCEKPVRTLDVSATVRDAIALMREGRFGSVVVTEGGKLAGILTERDILMRVAGEEPAMLDDPIATIMTADPESLRGEDDLLFLMNKMHVGGFRHVPIVNDAGVPEHVISLRDVLSYLLDHFGSIIVNLPPEPFRGEPKVESG